MVNLLLNACEFAEHDEKVLPIDPKMLGRYALQHRAFAKALHYKELEWFTDASADVLKALINVNSKLQQPDTAWGVLNYARNDEERFDHAEFEYEKWYVELNEWKEAYAAFERKAAPGEEDGDIIFGKMKCLHALGEWDQLSDFAQSRWGQVGAAEHRTMAPLAAAAAWALKQWDLMEDYVAVMRKDSPDYFFYRAVISIHANQYSRSLKYINKARDSVDPELHSLFEESYSRAYKWVPSSLCWGSISTDAYIPLSCQCSHPNSDAVRARRDCCLQAERRSAGSPGDNAQDVDEEVRSARARVRSPRANIFPSFPHRLKGCEQDVEIWQRILSVRSLVLTPSQDKEMWIKFANLCRKSDRLGLAEKTLNSLLGPQDSSAPEGVSLVFHPCLYYASLTLPTPFLAFTGSPGAAACRLRLLQVHLGPGLSRGDAHMASVVHGQADVRPGALHGRHHHPTRGALGVYPSARSMLPETGPMGGAHEARLDLGQTRPICIAGVHSSLPDKLLPRSRLTTPIFSSHTRRHPSSTRTGTKPGTHGRLPTLPSSRVSRPSPNSRTRIFLRLMLFRPSRVSCGSRCRAKTYY